MLAGLLLAAAWAPGTALAAWSRPVTLTKPGNHASFPTVASNARGDVVVAWYRLRQSGDQAMARTSTNGGRSWGPAQLLGPAVLGISDNPPAPIRAAVAANGEAVIT